MISGIFHQSSGLGNQLHRLITTRVLATDKGFEYGMIYNANDSSKPANFKGTFFLEQPRTVLPAGDWKQWSEKKVVENGVDIRSYDPEINFVEDNTIIDGEFQDERYFGHRLNEVREWLKVEPLDMDDDLCVIGFRGGEYALYPDLFLTKDYWDKARKMMIQKYPGIRFEVHTDDPETAKKFFPIYPIIHDVGLNWRSVRYAKHLIVSNSSFYILPALLNEDVEEVIAPRYWARRNTKVWALPQNYYKGWTYI